MIRSGKRARETPRDGRKLRRYNNGRRIVNAMLELVRAGSLEPRAEDVALRAGVGLRTVFRHFDDMETLYRRMAAAMRSELQPIVAAPLAAPDLTGKLAEIIDRRTRLFERAMPFKNAADVHRHRSPFLRKDLASLRAAERAALAAIMPPSILSDAPRFAAIDAMLSFAMWQHLRREQKLTPKAARAALEAAAIALISDRTESSQVVRRDAQLSGAPEGI